ncbi:5',5'''-P-1,P-4-tetraphosphate phosphorylase 2 [Stemphylium lycopersici]|nr:5',5'''-P-1,P-4-tetraphosphate phosphorylase 2 [Stemphylium lycopersici]
MADAQVPNQHCNPELILYRHSGALPHLCLPYAHGISAASHQFGNADHDLVMAQSMLADTSRPSSYMQPAPWTLQAPPSGDASSAVVVRNETNSSVIYPSDQTWSGGTGASSSFNWHQAIQQVEPYIMHGSELQFDRNRNLLYNPMVAQDGVAKGYPYTGEELWAQSPLHGLPRTLNIGQSDATMRTSISPKSYASDDFDDSYSPGSMPDHTSPVGNWHAYPTSSSNPVVPSHRTGSYNTDGDLTGLPHMKTSVPIALLPSVGCNGQGQVSRATEEATMPGSEYSYSHTSSPGASQWYLPNYSYDISSLPLRPRNAMEYNNYPASDTSPSPAYNDRQTQCRPAPWTSSQVVPTQDGMQARFQLPRSATAQAQRDHNDRLLVEGKKKGETYKEIKMKMVGEKPAESTLRGRYRSLTKARKDRVRKPVWTKIDIKLLNETVQHEFDRIERNLQNPYSLSFEQKLTKVAWKKVADYIDGNALPNIARRKFDAAKASSDLLFSPTELAIIRTSNGIPFQLRYCPSLAKKPLPKLEGATPKQKIDPFENPPEALHLVDIPATNPTHFLVLNKFPIISQHFILATKPNKRQTHVLEQDDLEATYACLKAWQQGTGAQQKRLLAFFNSGEHSGASQPHRHLQFLPVEGMRDGDKTSGWNMLIDLILSRQEANPPGTPAGLLQHPSLPFTHFGQPFDSEPSGTELLKIYNRLYTAAKASVDAFVSSNPGQLALHPVEDGDLPISYNLAMTTAGMVILPRRAEGTWLRRDDGTNIGFVALNGTTLGGTLMVKHQDEWDMLRNEAGLLDTILSGIGIPQAAAAKAGASNM